MADNNNDNSDSSSKYDPNTVIAAANAAPTLDGGRFIFQSALLEWVDDAREGGSSGKEDSVREAIATLWLAYAQYLIQAKQFKSAITDAYEEAVRCPVAGSVGRVYAEYARFAVERNKRKTAQDVYLRALVKGAVTDEQDRELLWNDFLEMMRETKPELTLAALQEAVQQEAGGGAAASSTDGGGEDDDDDRATTPQQSGVDPPAKRQKHQDGNATAAESKTHVVTTENVEQEAKVLAESLRLLSSNSKDGGAAGPQQLPPEITAAWMSRDGNYPPQPPEFALFAPSPPKLSDPTAKDILGIDLAVPLIERLLDTSGSLVLEVCRGLWALQALKEQESHRSLAALDKTLLKEHERVESELDARLSVAGAASDAVRQMNDRERHSFQMNAGQRRQNVLTTVAWELRKVLCWQQQILAKLQVPGFEEGPTVDDSSLQFQSQICQYLHSAFFIRNKMGASPHETMLKSQLRKLKKEQQGGGSRSPMGGSSPVPPMRQHSPVPPPAYNLGTPQHPPPPVIMQAPPQGAYNYPPPPLQQQPIMGGMPPQYMQHQQQYGQHTPMMMGPPPVAQGLPPLPPNQQQPPPPPPPPGSYGGQQQQQYPPYYQQQR